MAEHIDIVLTVCGFFALACVSLVVYIYNTSKTEIQEMKKEFTILDKKVSNLEIEFLKELMEIKTNYTDRFDDVKRTLSQNHLENTKSLDDLKLAIEGQKQFCYLIQEGKKTQ